MTCNTRKHWVLLLLHNVKALASLTNRFDFWLPSRPGDAGVPYLAIMIPSPTLTLPPPLSCHCYFHGETSTQHPPPVSGHVVFQGGP